MSALHTNLATKESYAANGHSLWGVAKRILQEQTLILVFIVIIVVMAISTPYFLKPRNLLNILLQSSMIGVSAAGMTMIILMADIDLSVGAMAAFAGVLAAKLQVESSWPTLPAILIPLAICFSVGIVVGLVVAKLGVHSFIATMGVLSIARGISFVITNGKPISGLRGPFDFIGQGTIGGFPLPAVIMLVILFITWFVLTQTRLGRAIYAIGGNKEATRLSGFRWTGSASLFSGPARGLRDSPVSSLPDASTPGSRLLSTGRSFRSSPRSSSAGQASTAGAAGQARLFWGP